MSMSDDQGIDFSKIGIDSYVRSLTAEQLSEVVATWDEEFHDYFYGRNYDRRPPDELRLRDLTDAIMLISEAHGLDSNEFVPIFRQLVGERQVLESELEPAQLVLQRLEMALRWEMAGSGERRDTCELNSTEQCIINALGSKVMLTDDISKSTTIPNDSGFRATLAAMRRHGILVLKRNIGYFVHAEFRHLVQEPGKAKS
jgi:hypothetical protein